MPCDFGSPSVHLPDWLSTVCFLIVAFVFNFSSQCHGTVIIYPLCWFSASSPLQQIWNCFRHIFNLSVPWEANAKAKTKEKWLTCKTINQNGRLSSFGSVSKHETRVFLYPVIESQNRNHKILIDWMRFTN